MDPARARAALEAGCSKTHRGTRTTPQYPPISTPNSTACRSAFQRVSSGKVKNMAGLRSRGGRLCSLNVRNEGHNREGDARAPPRPPMLAPCVAPPLFSMVNAILSPTGEAVPMQWDGVTLKAFAGAVAVIISGVVLLAGVAAMLGASVERLKLRVEALEKKPSSWPLSAGLV